MNKLKVYHWNGEEIEEGEMTKREIEISCGAGESWYDSIEECLRNTLTAQEYCLKNEQYKVKIRLEKINKIRDKMAELCL